MGSGDGGLARWSVIFYVVEMARQPARRGSPLGVDAIVDAACALIDEVGLAGLSMRRLGNALEVDPMAVYHHVAGKRELLRLVTERVIAAMPLPDAAAAWEVQVRQWAQAYWEVVVAHRDLTAAGLADPVIAAGGVPAVRPLREAIASSGIPAALVEPNAWLVVDFVHGSALGASAPLRHHHDDLTPLRRAFDAGLDTIIAGLAARSGGATR
jgi:AcrR family transcriptional regulator